MRVLYFHQYFSTPSGSTGTRSYEMAKMLIKRGHKVIMVCGSGHMSDTGLSDLSVKGMKRGMVDGIDVIELDIPYSNHFGLIRRTIVFLLFALRSIFLAMTLDYELLFATSTPLTSGIPGIFATIFRRKRFVFEVRDLWPELPRAMGIIKNPIILYAMSILEWISYHCAKGCIGLSPGIVKGIVRRGVSTEKVIMIPNACDLNIFNPEIGKILRPDGIDNKNFVVIFSGAHGIANGLDSVLDVANVLKKRSYNNIKFIFIGDGKKKPELIKRCEIDGLNNCLFIDPVNKKKLNSFFKGADIGLMVLSNIPAFYYGTSPNKFFDYISSGLPVINNYPGWIADMIIKNNCGVVVEPNNPEVFADVLIALAEEKNMIKLMGINARKLAEEEFNREKIADIFVDFLEKIVK